MDWPAHVIVAIALVLLFAAGLTVVGMLVGAVSGIAIKRSRASWRNFAVCRSEAGSKMPCGRSIA